MVESASNIIVFILTSSFFILLHPSSSFFILLHPFLSITENKEGSEKGCAWQTFYDRNQLTCHMSHVTWLADPE